MANREIELHFVARKGVKFLEIVQGFSEIFGNGRHTEWEDRYYRPLDKNSSTYVRHRFEFGGQKVHELTYKDIDKGNIIDRKEINFPLPYDKRKDMDFLLKQIAQETDRITKIAYVFEYRDVKIAVSFVNEKYVALELESIGASLEVLYELKTLPIIRNHFKQVHKTTQEINRTI